MAPYPPTAGGHRPGCPVWSGSARGGHRPQVTAAQKCSRGRLVPTPHTSGEVEPKDPCGPGRVRASNLLVGSFLTGVSRRAPLRHACVCVWLKIKGIFLHPGCLLPSVRPWVPLRSVCAVTGQEPGTPRGDGAVGTCHGSPPTTSTSSGLY